MHNKLLPIFIIFIAALCARHANAGVILRAPNSLALSRGLVGYWTFDGKDISGVQAYDKSGNGNRGILTNGPTQTIGQLGQAMQFDGSNDYVNIGAPASLNNLTEKTISAWIYPKSTGKNYSGRIADKNQGGSSLGWLFAVCDTQGAVAGFCSGNNILTYTHRWSGGTIQWDTSANVIQLNAWNHVVLTYNDSSTSNIPHIYVNGSAVAVNSQSPSGSSSDDSGAAVTIGDRSTNDGSFDGLMDDVRVYNRVLSADEIKRLYNMGR